MRTAAGASGSLREISRGAITACAIERGTDGVIVRKRLVLDREVVSERRWGSHSDRFAAMAGRQAALAEACPRVASVVASSPGEVVTRYCRFSGETLLRHCSQPSPELLRAVSIAAFVSLRDLHASGAAHGNVKPGNVLLPRLSLRSAEVLWTDPGPDGNTSADEDARHLGAFLHLFATGQVACEDGSDAPERWRHLGSSAEVWCRVVRSLLGGDADLAAAIAQVRGSTRGTAPRARTVAAIVMPLAVVSVAGGILVLQNDPAPEPEATTWDAQSQKRWEALCLASDRWLLRFVQEVSTEALERDEHLRQEVASSVRQIREGSLVVDPRAIAAVEGMPTYAELAQQWSGLAGEPPDEAAVGRAAGVAESIERALARDEWPLLARLAEMEVLFEGRGWSRLASIAGGLRSGVDLNAARGLAAVVEDAIVRGQRLVAIERQWQRLAAAESVFEPTGNPLLARFDEALASATREVDQGGDPIGEQEALLQAWSNMYDRLVQTVREQWEGLDAQLLNSETRGPAGVGSPPLDAFEAFLTRVEDPIYQRIDVSVDPHPATAIRARFDALAARASDVDAALPEDTEVSALLTRMGSIAAEVESFEARPWNRRTREPLLADAAGLARTVGEIEPTLIALEFASTTTIREFSDALAMEASISVAPQIDAVWRRQRDALIVTHADDADVRQLAASIRVIRQVLASLESASGVSSVDNLAERLPEGVRREIVSGAYRDVANRSLDSMLSELNWAPTGELDDPRAGDRIAASQGLNETRVDTITRMFQELASARQSLSRGVLGDESGPDGAAPFSTWDAWAATPEFVDMRVPEALPELDTTITRIRELRTLDAREALVGIQQDDPFEVVLDAWARMSDATPPWPIGIIEFRREREIRARVAEASQAGIEPVRERMVTLGLERWLGAHGAISTTVELEELLDASAEFYDSGSALPIDAAYNLAVREFTLQLADADGEAQARQVAGTFMDRVEAIDPGRATARVRETMDRVREILSDTGDSADPAALGPATVGWRGEASPDNSSIVFSRSIDGIERRLEFVFVPVPGDNPVYLATEELSIGLFSAIASRGDAWEELSAQWLELAGAMQGDSRWTGARGWSWRDDRLLGNGSWMVQDPTMSGRAVLAGDLDPAQNPSPTLTHPMQDVSVLAAARVAALAGCRLPRPGEYRDAYQVLRDPTSSTWNLRDAALSAQEEHADSLRAQGVRISDPDESAFDPQPSTAEMNDGTVWFLAVGDGSGEPFRNLIGNVAEFVEIEGGGHGVVGGSSLSSGAADPAFEVWPLPLARARTGFGDVGMRLAFDAPGVISRQPIREALADLIDTRAYILPNSAGGP